MEGEKLIFYICRFISQTPATTKAELGGSQELRLLHGRWGLLLPPGVHISRKLGWKQSWDSAAGSLMGDVSAGAAASARCPPPHLCHHINAVHGEEGVTVAFPSFAVFEFFLCMGIT